MAAASPARFEYLRLTFLNLALCLRTLASKIRFSEAFVIEL